MNNWKFQKEQQKHQDSQLIPLEKVPEIDWTHNDGRHSHCTIWKEQWNAIFKSDHLFASDAVKVHKLYKHIGDEGQKKIKQWKLNLDEITSDQLFERLDEECKPGGSAYRSRSDLWHNTKQGNMTLDDFYNKIETVICVVLALRSTKHFTEMPFCSIWTIKALHNEWFSSCQKKMPIPQTSAPSISSRT